MITIADRLVNYGLLNLGLNILDANYVRNKIFHLLNIYSNEPFVADVDDTLSLTPHEMRVELESFIIQNKIKEEGFECNLLIDEIFGLLMPLPSAFIEEYDDIYTYSGDVDAIRYLTKLEVNSNYINLFNVNKNIKWEQKFDKNIIEYTINLSKPEKSNADIKAALSFKGNNSLNPKCVLCYENEGYYGAFNKEPRSTIRVIPLNLNAHQWYMQLSPYVYFENHLILLNKDHVPMVINENTLQNLLDFVDQYPNFFLGSNADLPIVGGSILNHEHYQGGTHIMPIMKSSAKYNFLSKNKLVKISYLDWFNSTLLLETTDKEALKKEFANILNGWIAYNDEELGIVAYTDKERHNTITPILRKVDNKYMLYLILRCNNTSAEFPEGIFHVHPQYFNIKHEGIGLIEAMGLYILPARLKSELGLIEEMFNSKADINEFIKTHEELQKHKDLIEKIEKQITKTSDVHKLLIDEISGIGKEILKNTGVFKENEDSHMFKFMESLGYKKGE
ncbi:MAG: galactose-1-phosphate uridylyltransferase [Bacilli bacterium]